MTTTVGGSGSKPWYEQMLDKYPAYRPGYNPSLDAVAPKVEDLLAGVDLDTRGLERFRSGALRTGPSAWSRLATDKAYAEEMDARERAGRTAAASAAEARSDLAAHGGLTSGARERINTGAIQAATAAGQDAGRQGSLARMGISVQDEANREQMLSQLPGMEIQSLQPGFQRAGILGSVYDSDAGRRAREAESENQYNFGKYDTYASGRSNERLAQATERAAKEGGSSFLCTELRRRGMMTPEETRIMTRFMVRAILPRADFYAWYLEHGPELVARLNARDQDWAAVKSFMVTGIIEYLNDGREDLAREKYASRVMLLNAVVDGESMRSSLLRPGLWKSLQALPIVLVHPTVRGWITARAKKWFRGLLAPRKEVSHAVRS